MTNEETMIAEHIDECNKRINVIKAHMNDVSSYVVDECKHNIEVLETAIRVAEKQIPKKVNTNIATIVKAFDGENKVETYKCVPCPVCGKWLVCNPSRKFCNNCGQKLKWD